MRVTKPALLDRHQNALVAAIAGAICIAFGAIFIRLSDVTPATAAFYRCLYALPVLAPLAWRERRSRGGRPRRAHLFALASGLFFGIDLVLWCESIVYVGAGLATVLANVQVVIFPLAAWALISERPSGRLTAAVPIALAGVVFISGEVGGGAYGRNPALGAVYGLGAGLAYTASLMCMKLAGEAEARHTRARLFEMTFSSVAVAGAIGVAIGQLGKLPGPAAQAWLILLALGSQVAGWLLITWALPRVAAGATALVLTLQPAGSVILAMIILGEKPSALQLLGVLAIVVAVPLGTIRSERRMPAVVEGPAQF